MIFFLLSEEYFGVLLSNPSNTKDEMVLFTKQRSISTTKNAEEVTSTTEGADAADNVF